MCTYKIGTVINELGYILKNIIIKFVYTMKLIGYENCRLYY